MVDMRSSRLAVDTRRAASLSFAAPEPTAHTFEIRPAPRPLIPPAVGPGTRPPAPVIGSGGLLGAMSEYPIQIEKVQAPPLRDDTLARDRLLDWLNVKIHNRVVLLTAEAGYGKTTLLADFARRTRLRVMWFRLDRGDRDWVGFIAYLLAAVRVHQPDFGPATASLLAETGSSAPPLDSVLSTFLRELGDLPPEPSVLIFDDFHLVDDSEDVRLIVDQILARAPERLSLVFASRQVPPVRLARLKSMGEVAELTRSDLRFDFAETGLLFTGESWSDQSSDLVGDVAARTEGWPASLQLVRTALKDRDVYTARAFVRSLSGGHGDMYDYLAEEVVGDLPEALQLFLMRTSVLEVVDLPAACAAASLSIEEVRQLVGDARRNGLLSKLTQAAGSEARAHPLVRQFLRARLERAFPPSAVRDIHRRVALAVEETDWRRAAYHLIEASDVPAAARLLEKALPRILATGSFHLAEEILRKAALDPSSSITALIIEARLALQRGDGHSAISFANQALALDPTAAGTITTVMAAHTATGDAPGGAEVARLFEARVDPLGRELARAYRLVIETSSSGSINTALVQLRRIGNEATASGSHRYAGVALTDQALLLKAAGRPQLALRAADAAIEALEFASAPVEEVSAVLARGWALAHLGDLDGARATIARAKAIAPSSQHVEIAAEVAELEFYYGDPTVARAELDAAGDLSGDGSDHASLMTCLLDAAAGDLPLARIRLDGLEPGKLRTTVAFEAARRATNALLALMTADATAEAIAKDAATFAGAQGARLWELYAGVIGAAAAGANQLSRDIVKVGARDDGVISMAAEAIAPWVAELSAPALSAVSKEARARPARWRPLLRAAISVQGRVDRTAAATLLAELGEAPDVLLFGRIGRSAHDPNLIRLSRALARRLCPRVQIRDLGRIQIRIGQRLVEGSQTRRKVLALLCLLLTKSHFSASREDVTESLWPDLDPGDALNSLNQTVYFLRRVFEPTFREEISPGYVHQDGETIWLDGELVEAASHLCREAISAMPDHPTISDALALLSLYEAPFALDFAYEEWAARYRDPLHASVLRIVEHALRDGAETREFRAAVALAERALLIEPDADEIQLALIDLYRMTGAHTAAAEQYERYATALRVLGVEPPPFADVHGPVQYG
jgi:ATP/maltotriose-dependent transcriptional regulator MalT/DNA-binding SARP family transcriptional activator